MPEHTTVLTIVNKGLTLAIIQARLDTCYIFVSSAR